MNSILFIFSCLGLIMSILTHFALQFGVNIQDYPVIPSLLHIGIFLTFAPSLILFMSKNKNETDEKGKKLGLRILYRNSPKVLIGLTFIVYLVLQSKEKSIY